MAENDLKNKLQELDESLRSRHVKIILSLDLDELSKVKTNKSTYKSKIKSEILELLLEVGDRQADETAQYISNLLSNEAQREKTRRLTKTDKPQTRKSKQNNVTKSDHSSGHEHAETSQIRLTNENSQQCGLSDTIIRELDSTMYDHNDSLNSTVTASQFDSTFDTNSDDSVTEQKTIAQTKDKDRNNKGQRKKKGGKQSSQLESSANLHTDTSEDSEIQCLENCSLAMCSNSNSLRCNICMVWYHTQCVGITDIDAVGAWVCGVCRCLPKVVNQMKSQINLILDTTTTFVKSFHEFTNKMESKYEGLNDRLTAISNQNKCCQQTTTDSLSSISKEIGSVKSDLERKADVIISKSHSIIDSVKHTADLVGKTSKLISTSDSPAVLPNNKNVENSHIKTPSQASTSKTNNSNLNQNMTIDLTGESEQTGKPLTQNKGVEQNSTIPLPKRDLTFITGSCILKSIDTKFLAPNVKVKSFQKIKIEAFHQTMTKMDLSRYENIIIHVGGYDIDENISLNSFREKYNALLTFLKNSGCKVYVSGLLPRGGTDMKQFNDILKDISNQNEAQFINNHNSFIMASGELPFDFFHADQVNLKFSGTRKLVHNIHDSCPILPQVNRYRNAQAASNGKMQRLRHLRRRNFQKQ